MNLGLGLGLCRTRALFKYNEDAAFKKYLDDNVSVLKIRGITCEQLAELLRRVWVEDLLVDYFDDSVETLVIDVDFYCEDLEALLKRIVEIE